jgi:hypothetical protein
VLSVPNEATGATLTYGAQVKAGAASLARKVGTTTSGKATIVLRIRPGTSTRRVRLRVEVTDAVGNKSSTTRTVPLPR